MKNVLVINQSAELYGSDKAILELIKDFPNGYNPIVVLHEEGPLKSYLENIGVTVIKSDVIKVKRGILKPIFILKLPFVVVKSIFKLNRQLKGKKISLIHSNSISVFVGCFYAFVFRIPHLWHVHEIIEKPKTIASLYPRVVNFFSDRIIFNSKATESHYLNHRHSMSKKSEIIYNGVSRTLEKTTEDEIKRIREQVFKANTNDTIIVLIGRISQIKGQNVLAKAFKSILNEFPNTKLVFIGSYVKSKKEYYDDLISLIDSLNLDEYITFVDFQENIWPYYDASDIVLMPSTEPESFGLVAAEALLSKKPVIASKIGALPEIILDYKTGLLFKSNDFEDLSKKISVLLNNPKLSQDLANEGFYHVNTHFSKDKFVQSFAKVYDEIV